MDPAEFIKCELVPKLVSDGKLSFDGDAAIKSCEASKLGEDGTFMRTLCYRVKVELFSVKSGLIHRVCLVIKVKERGGGLWKNNFYVFCNIISHFVFPFSSIYSSHHQIPHWNFMKREIMLNCLKMNLYRTIQFFHFYKVLISSIPSKKYCMKITSFH